jgi:hypothetical protein
MHVVVTCTDKKTVREPSELAVRTLPRGSPSVRAMEWIRRLQTSSGDRVAVRKLYLGNSWSIAKSLEPESDDVGIELSLWIASAGYGMLSMDSEVHPYAATFSHGPDSIGNEEAGQSWWKTLAQWRVPGVACRSFTELVAKSSGRPVLVAASASYVAAMRDDLTAAAQLSSPSKFGIVSAGFRKIGELEPYIVPADSRFQRTLKGPTHSLNVAIVRHAVRASESWYPDVTELRAQFGRELKSLLPMAVYDHAAQSDEQVQDFIRRESALSPEISRTQLLRRLRSKGLACEQARFKKLYLSLLASSSA